jgi:hypothetical protein
MMPIGTQTDIQSFLQKHDLNACGERSFGIEEFMQAEYISSYLERMGKARALF